MGDGPLPVKSTPRKPIWEETSITGYRRRSRGDHSGSL